MHWRHWPAPLAGGCLKGAGQTEQVRSMSDIAESFRNVMLSVAPDAEGVGGDCHANPIRRHPTAHNGCDYLDTPGHVQESGAAGVSVNMSAR
jgi:hypothetical protein